MSGSIQNPDSIQRGLLPAISLDNIRIHQLAAIITATMSQKPPTIIPRALKAGDTVAFVSPSERVNATYAAPLRRAQSAVEALGFRVKVVWTPGSSPETTTISQSITHRIAELREAFGDPDVAAIICASGGTTATELLPALLGDEDLLRLIRENPKVFVGYSDITALHWALAAATGLRTFYGPTVVQELGEAPAPQAFTVRALLRAVSEAAPLGALPQSDEYAPRLPDYILTDDRTSTAPRELRPTPARRWLRGGVATGPLFGGFILMTIRLAGASAVAPDWTGKIMFLETAMGESSDATGYPLQQIQKCLGDLAAAGVFEKIEGLVLGRCLGYDSPEAIASLEKVVGEALAVGEEGCAGRTKQFPILMHADFGHTNPMLTLPMGAMARLDATKDEFAILEPGVVQ